MQLKKQIEDKEVQSDSCTTDEPKLRINRPIFTDKIKQDAQKF